MSQHDYTIANQGFPATRADINNALSAIATNNSGTSAPSTQYAGQFWIDTTSSTWTMYIHDGTDDIQFATIDTSANTVNFIDSALDVVTDTTPQLGGDLDLNSNDITGTGDINITGDITASGNLTSTGIDDNATSTAITIDSSENVGIGTSSPSSLLQIKQSTDGSTSSGLQIRNTANTSSIFIYQNGSDTVYDAGSAGDQYFITGSSERMRILSGGQVKIGTPIPSSNTPGLGNNDQGVCFRGGVVEQFFINSNNTPCFFGKTADGSLVAFQSAGTQEGSITVSGATVSYNGFTGTHWSRFTDNSTPTILKGTVLESLDEMCDWYNLEFDITKEDGSTYSQRVPHILQDGQSVGDTVAHSYEGTDVQATIVKETDIKHVKSKVSDTVDAKNVYGVFSAWDEDGEGYNDFYVASVGSFVVRIKAGETVAKGDLLQSNGDGTAKVQTDDNVKSSSFAKVLSTTVIETYEDGSYLVPCSLMC